MPKDLRLVFDEILMEWGHDILLEKVLNPHEPNARPKYTGEDGQRRLERHTVRRTYPGSRALGSVAQEEIEGMLHDYEFIYYFRHNVDPVPGDRIYENMSSDNLFDNLGRLPDFTTFTVDLAISMRGKGGEIVYWVAGVTRDE